jgi:ketosteroid isomerase-like protein
MIARLLACVLAVALSACETPPPELTEAEVQDFVRQYVAAANAADAAKVMGFIQQDEAVTSVGLGVIHRGWKAINAATGDAYAQDVRVKVTIEKMDVMRIGRDSALATAPVSVSTNQPVETARGSISSAPGAMSVLVKRTPEGLRVIHDHYSLSTF